MNRFVAVVLSLTLSSLAAAHEVGDSVVVIQDAQVRLPGGAVAQANEGETVQVNAVNGKWLWVSTTQAGWIDSASVIAFGEAIPFFTKRIERNPRDENAWFFRGKVWQAKGEYDIAIKDYNEAIRLYPTDAAYYAMRSQCWEDKGELDRALSDLNEALRQEGETSMYCDRGNIWRKKGEPDKAIADYSHALRSAPNDAITLACRGRAWSDKGEWNRAIADYSAAIKLDSHRGSAYADRGWAYIRLGMYDRAAADLALATRLSPEDSVALNVEAWLLATCPEEAYRDGAKAIQRATKACQLTDFQDATLLDTLAASYAELGDFSKAAQWQAKAVKLAAEEDRSLMEEHLKLYQSNEALREQPGE